MADSIAPPYDLHLHTFLSPCGSQEKALSAVGAYAESAKRLGLELICITDHFALPAPWTPEWYEGSGPEIIDLAAEAARQVDNGVTVLVGCEAEMVAPDKVTIDADFVRSCHRRCPRLVAPPGTKGRDALELSPEGAGLRPLNPAPPLLAAGAWYEAGDEAVLHRLEASHEVAFADQLDFVLLAASHLHFPEIGPPPGAPPRVVAATLTEFLAAAVSLPFVDAIAHPLNIPHDPYGPPEDYFNLISDDTLEKICAVAASNSVAFEMNGYQIAQERFRLLMRRFYLIAKSHGVKFTVGSDAHRAESMTKARFVEGYAREIGLERTDFLSVDEILRRSQARGCAFS